MSGGGLRGGDEARECMRAATTLRLRRRAMRDLRGRHDGEHGGWIREKGRMSLTEDDEHSCIKEAVERGWANFHGSISVGRQKA